MVLPETLQQTALPVETEREGIIPILISGLPGKMATLVAEAIEHHGDFELLPLALSSVRHHQEARQIGERKFTLLTLNEPFRCRPNHLAERTIAVDFTKTDSVFVNARYYAESHIPFVMGTSVGDHGGELAALVRNSQISAVIIPNMASSVVRKFITQIEDRDPVERTLMAIRFLARRMTEGSHGQVYSMTDVKKEARRYNLVPQGGEVR